MTFISPMIPILMGVAVAIGIVLFILAVKDGFAETLLERNYQFTWAGICVFGIPVLLLIVNYGIMALDLIRMFNNQT